MEPIVEWMGQHKLALSRSVEAIGNEYTNHAGQT